MRRPSLFKGRDATKLAKAVRAAGFEIARVEVDKNGVIRVILGKPGDTTIEPATNDLDNWIEAHAD